jgi:hypothetical protein
MGREIQSAGLKFASTGVVLKSTSDEIVLTSYAGANNVQSDIENSMSVRNGMIKAESTSLAATPRAIGYLQSGSVSYRFCVASNTYYRAVAGSGLATTGATGLSGNPVFFACYTLVGSESVPHIFMADGSTFLKHDGVHNVVRRVGIPAPGTGTIALDAVTGVTVDAGSATSGSGYVWTAGPTTPPAAITLSGGILELQVTGPNEAGYVRRAYAPSGGFGTDDSETIEISLQYPTALDARSIDSIYLQFSLGDANFTTRYEAAITPSIIEGATQTGERSQGAIDASQNLVYLTSTGAVTDSNQPSKAPPSEEELTNPDWQSSPLAE